GPALATGCHGPGPRAGSRCLPRSLRRGALRTRFHDLRKRVGGQGKAVGAGPGGKPVSAAGLLLSVSLAATAAGDATVAGADLLDRAEAAFRAGVSARQNSGETRRCFREAASHYETLRQRGADNADLEGNLGNAYLLAGDLARAILAYRRGLRLNPGDP